MTAQPPGPPDSGVEPGSHVAEDPPGFDDDAFRTGSSRTVLVVAIMAALLIAGLVGAAVLMVTVLGDGGDEIRDARSPDGTLVMSVPEAWASTSDAIPGTAPGSTIYRLDAVDADGSGRASVAVLAPAPGDPISDLPATLDALLASVPGCTFAEPEAVRDEAERAALVTHGDCASGPAVALAGATYTEDSRESWTVLVEGGGADPHEILDSVRIFDHDETGALL